MRTYIKNARLITPFDMTDRMIIVEDDKIVGITGHAEIEKGARVVDAGGLYASPGFIDIHVHGGNGLSVLTEKSEDIVEICRAHARYGTTGILPTTSSAPVELLQKSIESIKNAQQMDTGAQILGAHLEGPCLSRAQSGAQAADALMTPAQFDMLSLVDQWQGVRMVGVAPELDGALALGDALAERGVVASIAHSDATYDQVEEATGHGYSDVTHLYSGCSGMVRVDGYRVPGVIEAGLNIDALTCQVIGDGKHLPYSLLSLIYRCKGPDKIILITDGVEFSAGTLQEGARYRKPSGVEVLFEDDVMKLPSRQAFAGSTATMSRVVRNMHAAGIPLKEAVRMATENPARRIGALGKGRLAPGMDADVILFDAEISVKWCMSRGQLLFSHIG